MPVSSVQPESRVQTLIEAVEEVLERHPIRCKHLHPAEQGKVYRLPYGLWAEACPECVDEFNARYGASDSERQARQLSRASTEYLNWREGR